MQAAGDPLPKALLDSIPGPTEATDDDIDVYDFAINGTGMTRGGWRGVCRAGLDAVFAARAERYGRPMSPAPAARPEPAKPPGWALVMWGDGFAHVIRIRRFRCGIGSTSILCGHRWIEVTDPAVAARLREFAAGPDVLDLTGGGEG